MDTAFEISRSALLCLVKLFADFAYCILIFFVRAVINFNEILLILKHFFKVINLNYLHHLGSKNLI